MKSSFLHDHPVCPSFSQY